MSASPWSPLRPAPPAMRPPQWDEAADRMYCSEVYRVTVRRTRHPAQGIAVFHLSISRVDGSACHDWRHFQRIKNEVLGEAWEAVEIYPAESRLHDGSNVYHLWAMGRITPAGDVPMEISLGYLGRVVAEETLPGAMQRPWPAGERPADVVGAAELRELAQRPAMSRGPGR